MLTSWETEKSHYCSGCTVPGVPIPDQRDGIHLPCTRYAAALDNSDRVMANLFTKGNCPTCNSAIYMQINSTTRECAECGTRYRGRAVKEANNEQLVDQPADI